MRTTIIKTIESEKVIGIVRLDEQAKIAPVLGDLVNAGIKVLEITTNTPGYANSIEKAIEKYPGVLIGAGTVTNIKLVREAIACGAQFIVTPNTNAGVVDFAHKMEVPVLMGAMTPTEIAVAVECGADFVKLFPADALGLNYFKSLLGPFNNTKFLAVGGISLANARAWLEAGACGVGIGASLTNGNLTDIKCQLSDLLKLIVK